MEINYKNAICATHKTVHCIHRRRAVDSKMMECNLQSNLFSCMFFRLAFHLYILFFTFFLSFYSPFSTQIARKFMCSVSSTFELIELRMHLFQTRDGVAFSWKIIIIMNERTNQMDAFIFWIMRILYFLCLYSLQSTAQRPGARCWSARGRVPERLAGARTIVPSTMALRSDDAHITLRYGVDGYQASHLYASLWYSYFHLEFSALA